MTSSTDREIEESLGIDSPLEDLYTDAMLNRKIRVQRKGTDPSLRDALDAATKRMRELYTLPENWERTRGVAIIDHATHTLVGNFSEYQHRTIPSAHKWLREHTPIAINATLEMDGCLGAEWDMRLGRQSWEQEHRACLPVLLDELMVEAPAVELLLKTRLGVITRAELVGEAQFASMNGSMILRLPAGTNIWEACGTDTKSAMRKQIT